MGGMGSCLYFCLIQAGCLNLFGSEIVGGLLLLLRLRMVLGSVMRRIELGLRYLWG